MTLRAVPANWFELLVARPWLGHALQVLAGTGEVQFDECVAEAGRIDIAAVRQRLAEQKPLLERFADHRPPPEFPPLREDLEFEAVIDRAVTNLALWCDRVAPMVERLEGLQRRAGVLDRLRSFLASLSSETDFDLERFRASYPGLRWFVYEANPDHPSPAADGPSFIRRYEAGCHSFFLVATSRRHQKDLLRELASQKLEVLPVPEDVTGSSQQAAGACEEKIATAQGEMAKLRKEIARLAAHHHVAAATGDLLRLRWLFRHLEGVGVSEHLARVNGWTSDPDGVRLRAAVEAAEIPAVLGLSAPPPGRVPPTVIRNPFWARPFEIFERLMGTPGLSEPDPTRVLALTVPLLFGYMFGDLGQGAVIAVAGWFLGRQWPMARILLPAGISAMIFGILFGSIFGSEHLIPALWLHPLEEPLPVLLVPVFLGAGLLILGILLGGLAAHWGGGLGSWMRREPPLIFFLLAGLIGAFEPAGALALAAVGAAWFLFGVVKAGPGKPRSGPLAAVGELAERLLQLFVNAVSFVRVGAFALAHAGLGLAVLSIAGGTESVVLAALVMVLGNAGIILLEGLVVSIQTTRLILFEFFVRFFRADGRTFCPTEPPRSFDQGSSS